jgi:general secretion pathway protein B
MSFILDALRKSELARERRALPGYVELPASRSAPSRLPLILGAIAVLLVVNVAVLTVVLLKRSPSGVAPTPATSNVSMRASEQGPASAPATHRTETLPENPTAPATPARELRPLQSEAQDDEPIDVPEPIAPPPRAVARATGGNQTPPPTAAGNARTLRADPDVPLLVELSPAALTGLPRLNLDLLVYSEEPKQRFVMVNGQRLREGDNSREGVVLEHIRMNGAVMNYHGTRFLLTRE